MKPTRYSGKNGFNEIIELSFAPDPGNKIHISNYQKGYVVMNRCVVLPSVAKQGRQHPSPLVATPLIAFIAASLAVYDGILSFNDLRVLTT